MVRYSRGILMRMSNTEDTKYIPYKHTQQISNTLIIFTQECIRMILSCEVFYHDLGQDQHYHIGWLAARDGIEELEKYNEI